MGGGGGVNFAVLWEVCAIIVLSNFLYYSFFVYFLIMSNTSIFSTF